MRIPVGPLAYRRGCRRRAAHDQFRLHANHLREASFLFEAYGHREENSGRLL